MKKDVPNVVKKIREANKGKNRKKLIDLYFNLIQEMKSSRRNKDFDEFYSVCLQSFSLIEILIKQTKKEFGSFDVLSIPVLELCPKYLAVMGKYGQLKNFQEVVEFFPELFPWKEKIEEAFVIYNLSREIVSIVDKNKCIYKKELKKKLKGEDVKFTKYFSRTLKMLIDLDKVVINDNELICLPKHTINILGLFRIFPKKPR